MAYMNQERKAKRAPAIRAILKKYGMKGSISVCNHSTLSVTLKSGELDLIGAANDHNRRFAELRGETARVITDTYQVNEYYIESNYDNETVKEFLLALREAMYGDDYFDHSDAMTDYFNQSHYISIKVGTWEKPYQCTALAEAA